MMRVSKFCLVRQAMTTLSVAALGVCGPAQAATTVSYQFLGGGFGTMTLDYDSGADLYSLNTLDFGMITGAHFTAFNSSLVEGTNPYSLYGDIQGLTVRADTFTEDFRIDFDPHLSTQTVDLYYSQLGSPLELHGYIVINQVAGAVPEASTWSLMLLGFGGMGLALRRRRKMAAVA
jgi:hypothetical protein